MQWDYIVGTFYYTSDILFVIFVWMIIWNKEKHVHNVEQ
jgi:hypothetical protein